MTSNTVHVHVLYILFVLEAGWYDHLLPCGCRHAPSCRYLDDIPHQVGELSAALVLSTHPHARISVDASAAVSCEGVMAYVSVDDVPGSNVTGGWGGGGMCVYVYMCTRACISG